jgi:hypothetical protein
MVKRILTITVAILSWAAIACGRVPIIVTAPRHQLALGKMVNNAEEQLKKGDLAGANPHSGRGTQSRSRILAGALHTREDFCDGGQL